MKLGKITKKLYFKMNIIGKKFEFYNQKLSSNWKNLVHAGINVFLIEVLKIKIEKYIYFYSNERIQ